MFGSSDNTGGTEKVNYNGNEFVNQNGFGYFDRELRICFQL
jgi:hypothetical protein